MLLTRDDDRNVPIDERTAIANNNKADLFISLHANASLRAGDAGASIYVAAFDDTTARRPRPPAPSACRPSAAGRARSSSCRGTSRRRATSSGPTAFAALLEQQLAATACRSPARPIDRAPLRVLESANMPAVLIEMGYLTNADQEKQLAGDAFQNAFVQALLDAVVEVPRLRSRRPTPPGARDDASAAACRRPASPWSPRCSAG